MPGVVFFNSDQLYSVWVWIRKSLDCQSSICCAILNCGWHRCSNNTLIVSIRELFMRNKLSALTIVSN